MPARKRRKPSAAKAPHKAWAGRFTEAPDPRAEAYTASLEVDWRLLPADIAGSLAHVEMLAKCKILSLAEARKIQGGLRAVLHEWEQGKLAHKPSDEDVHMLVERRLHELIGPVAGKVHTARSRNDQVALDFKLYLRGETEHLAGALRLLQRSLLRLAEKHRDWIMPGYTHLQTAQPVLVAHWLLAHLEAFARDERRLWELRQGSLEDLPLGAAALAGTSHPIDRQFTARLLGFARVTDNSLDTVADRDFALEFLSAAAICGVHLSRLAEELVLFSSHEFRFITLSQRFATGSSIMPQKRNPDVAELIRGRSSRLNGCLVTLLTVLKGLPLTYNRDLQEDKVVVFEAADILDETLLVLCPMLDTLRFNRERLEQACSLGFPTATEAADHLVRQGVPFRQAHEAVGRLVTWASEADIPLESIPLERWRAFHPAFQPGVLGEVGLRRSVAAKRSWGGTAPNRVAAALQRERKRLGKI
ncbi:MAG: argininosuccinate lyase [candidate division FCPU426 bacterium]